MVAAKPFPVSCLTVLALLVQIVALLQQAEPKSYQGVYVAGDIILGKNVFNLGHWLWQQLVEQSLPTPEIRGSNTNFGKNLSVNLLIAKYGKVDNQEKEAGVGPFFKRNILKTCQRLG